MKLNIKHIAIFILLLSTANIFAQRQIKVSGKIQDASNDESLSFANVVFESERMYGTTSNADGDFVVELQPGVYKIKATYIGYQEKSLLLNIKKDTSLLITLIPSSKKIEEVVVEEQAFYGQQQVQKTTMSTISLERKLIQRIPNIAGEQDILKVVQLQPGVSRGIEGSGDFFVRGGDADQNLLTLDGATVYNTGHLFGFISVFNPDIIGDATFIKGAFPANYGGRLSSVLDIRTRNDATEKPAVEGSIGVISSKITVRQSSKNEKLTFLIAGRRTYIDRVLDVLDSEVQVPYYFYDLNGKVTYQLNNNNQFYFSNYIGSDILDVEQPSRRREGVFQANFTINNDNQSFGWKHLFNEKTFSDLTLTRTFYDYRIFNSFLENEIRTSSGIEDYTAQYQIRKYESEERNYTFGVFGQSHQIDPIDINSQGLVSNFFPTTKSTSLNFIEGAVYGNIEQEFAVRWKASLGYRHSFAIADGEVYHNYEPRVSFRYQLNDLSSLKAGYSRMSQYMHRVSSSAITLPVDLWYGVTKDIKPQTANQWVLGYVKTWPELNTIIEAELYYKDMNQITEYAEGTNLILNAEFEDALLQGEGESYGLELMTKKEMKKWQTTVSYTLNWSDRFFEELNNGKRFPAKYDRRHNISIVGMYDITDRLSFSVVWEYISGSRFTPVIGQYSILNPINSGIDLYNIYTDRNQVRLAATHRMDVLLVWKSRQERKIQSEWHFGVYNLYNRASPIGITIEEDENGGLRYEQPGIFGTIPTVSYHFKF